MTQNWLRQWNARRKWRRLEKPHRVACVYGILRAHPEGLSSHDIHVAYDELYFRKLWPHTLLPILEGLRAAGRVKVEWRDVNRRTMREIRNHSSHIEHVAFYTAVVE